MSQDLFAAFANEDQNQANPWAEVTGTSSTNFLDDWNSPAATQQTAGQSEPIREDDWGEFEAAEEQHPTNTAPASRYHYDLNDLGSTKPPQSIVAPDNFDLLGLEDGIAAQSTTKASSIPVTSKDPNVLFDADESEEDDFGGFDDFEDYQEAQGVEQPTKSLIPELDLLGLNEGPVKMAVPEPELPQRSPVASNAPGLKLESKIRREAPNSISKPKAKPRPVVKPKPVIKSSEPAEDEAWDDFSEWDNNTANPPSVTAAAAAAPSPLMQDSLISTPTQLATEDSLPPTNIPPPVILLSIFPEIFARVESELLKSLSSKSQAEKVEVYCEPRTIDFLRQYMLALEVCARIIAGRKLRWKRDTILAQSMRIGSASAGRVSGMKVTSVDRTEIKKEDGQVAEVLRLWSLQSGKIKSAVGEARKAHPNDLQSVPDLKETIPVKAIKQNEGGVPSIRPCALCGLKREERLAKVDSEVNDSFGEWWVEKTNMHRACRDFWINHETALRQR